MERAAGTRTPGRAARTWEKSNPSGVASERAALLFFRDRLRAPGPPPPAGSEKAYLRSNLRFYGTAVPDIRRVAAEFARAHPDLGRADLRRIVRSEEHTSALQTR